MFSKVDHMLDHKTSLNEFKRIEIIKYFVRSQWYETRINHRKKNGKRKKSW